MKFMFLAKRNRVRILLSPNDTCQFGLIRCVSSDLPIDHLTKLFLSLVHNTNWTRLFDRLYFIDFMTAGA